MAHNIHKIIQLELMELPATIKKVIPIFNHQNSKMKKSDKTNSW